MKVILSYSYKIIRKILSLAAYPMNALVVRLLFIFNNVNFGTVKSKGIPYISVAVGATFKTGDNLRLNNTLQSNPIGRVQRCIFFVGKDAHLEIGNNVGMSSTAIVCHSKITIHDNVKFGGGVCVYDTDFHSLDSKNRNSVNDFDTKKNKEVIIMSNAFIGAHSTILKGVRIGKNSIIGACSVVTKDVPDNEIWAGNPAKYIRDI